MSNRCELKFHNGIDAPCDDSNCPFWRVVDHLRIVPGGEGCAIQYFGLLGEQGSEISGWLLTVKERLEAEQTADEAAAAAIGMGAVAGAAAVAGAIEALSAGERSCSTL